MRHTPGWPEFCMALMGLSLGGILAAVAMLGRVGVDGSFVVSALSFTGLVVGLSGMIWWAMLDWLRRPLPSPERILYGGLIFLLVPVGAILYYWLIVRSSTSPQSSARD